MYQGDRDYQKRSLEQIENLDEMDSFQEMCITNQRNTKPK